MILAVDVGNTNIVIGCIANDKIHFVSRLSTDKNKTEDEYAISFKNVIKLYGIDLKKIDGCIISSVVPPLINIHKRALKKITSKTPIVIGNSIKTGLNIDIDNDKQLGSDLIVDAVAALNEYPPPIVIFDMGTATTVSVIDKNKNYIGGMVMPGLKISLEALSSRTSQLPHISLDTPKQIIGKNTIDCMKSGVIYGSAAMMDGVIDRIEETLGEKVTAVATGGLSSCVVPYCKKNVIYDDNLLLKGLMIIYNNN